MATLEETSSRKVAHPPPPDQSPSWSTTSKLSQSRRPAVARAGQARIANGDEPAERESERVIRSPILCGSLPPQQAHCKQPLPSTPDRSASDKNRLPGTDSSLACAQ